MIEAIIQRIKDRGYEVRVLAGVLLIRRRVAEEIMGIDWAIPRYDLNNFSADELFDQVDYRISKLDQAIKERQQAA